MKKILIALFLFFPFVCRADDLADVKKFSMEMINHYQNDIFRSKKSKSEKLKQFNKEFVNLFHLKSIIPVVLGPAYKKATDEEKQKFEKAFVDFNLASFAGYFDDYANRDFILVSANPAKNKDQYFVKMNVVNPQKADDIVELQWRFKKVDGSYKVIDAVVAEVSMILNYKTEYANIIKQATADGKNPMSILTNKIIEKTKTLKNA